MNTQNFFIIFMLIQFTCLYSTEKQDIDKIKKNLSSNNSKDRISAILKFSSIKKKLALKNLKFFIPNLQNQNLEIRKISTIVIGDIFLETNNSSDSDYEFTKVFNPKRIEITESQKKEVYKIIDLLILNLTDENSDIRSAAANSLGSIGPLAKKAIPHLIQRLQDHDDFVKQKVIIALGNMGKYAKVSIPFLKKFLNHNNRMMQLYAKKALEYIGK